MQSMEPNLCDAEEMQTLSDHLAASIELNISRFGKVQAQLHPLIDQLQCAACDNPEPLVADQLLLPMCRKVLFAKAEQHAKHMSAAAEAAADELLHSEVCPHMHLHTHVYPLQRRHSMMGVRVCVCLCLCLCRSV